MKEIFDGYRLLRVYCNIHHLFVYNCSKMEDFSERTIQQWLKMRKQTLLNILLGKVIM